jgi:hypothetical protein
MQEELFEDFAKSDEEPRLCEWYFPDFRAGHHGEYKLALYGRESMKLFKGIGPYPLGNRTQAEGKLKELREAWEKRQLALKLKAAEDKAKMKPQKK